MEVFLASSVRSRTVVRFFRPQLPPTSPLFGSLPLGIMPPASDQIHRPQLKAFLGNQSSEEEELQPERRRGNKDKNGVSTRRGTKREMGGGPVQKIIRAAREQDGSGIPDQGKQSKQRQCET